MLELSKLWNFRFYNSVQCFLVIVVLCTEQDSMQFLHYQWLPDFPVKITNQGKMLNLIRFFCILYV